MKKENVKPAKPAKVFKTDEELFKNRVFKKEVTKVLNRVLAIRKSQEDKLREHKDPAMKFKRTWLDRMGYVNQKEVGDITPKYFIDNILPIMQNKSQLSSEIRNVIRTVCSEAYAETMHHYGAEKPVEK